MNYEIRIETSGSDKYYYINAYIDDERVGKLGIEYKDEKLAKIIYVITNKGYTGRGIATMLINKAIETFKDYTLVLNVVPMPREGESLNHRTVKGLTEFYKKFGFERTSEPCVPTMIRNKLKDIKNI